MKRSAFTLIELLVSIGLVLIIILGVNAVFKMASDTVGTGMALGAADRANRSAQTVFVNDVRTGLFVDGPMLLIRSERIAAFRYRADEFADRDGNPLSQDFNNDNDENDGGEVATSLIYNNRNHRIDRVAFFASDMYLRQTGTDRASGTSFVDPGSSAEAFIWYGHLAQPDFSGGTGPRFPHRAPGETPKLRNANNYFATDWILGRSVILLNDQLDADPPVMPTPLPNYIEADVWPPTSPPPAARRLLPLRPSAAAKDPDSAGVIDTLLTSRYDLAATSVNEFKQRLVYDIGANGVKGTAGGATEAWWEILAGKSTPGGPPIEAGARFQGYTYPSKPLNGYGLARTVPVFVPGCTQFIVEYAGDYLNQDPTTGNISGTYLNGPGSTDGQIDYVIQSERPVGRPPQKVRRMRWYGMPRNSDVSNDRAGPVIIGGLAATAEHNLLSDVVPLRDALASAGVSTLPDDFFEHFVNLPLGNAYHGPIGSPAQSPNYYAAWGPSDLAAGSATRPKMLRITMTVDEPNGRMAEGQSYEYIMDLP